MSPTSTRRRRRHGKNVNSEEPKLEQMENIMENPERDAAIHFGAFLQLKGLTQDGADGTYGTIRLNTLLDQFSNHYQPQYRSYLVLPELLQTLRRYRVIRRSKPSEEKNGIVHINKHPNPAQVRPPGSVPRPRLYVDQSRVLRERVVRSDAIPDQHCLLCDKYFTNVESKQEHIDSDLHKFRLQYRQKRSSFKSEVGGSSIIIEGASDNGEMVMRTDLSCTFSVKVVLDAEYTVTNVYKIIELDQVKITPTEFRNGEPVEISVTAMFPEPGAYISPLVVKVMPAQLCLLKDLIFRVQSELIDQLAAISPYVKRQDVIREMEGPIIPGEDLKNVNNKLLPIVKLSFYKVLPVYNKLLLHKFEKSENMNKKDEQTLNKVLKLLCGTMPYRDALRKVGQVREPFIEPLNAKSYSDRFDLLVDLDELQQQRQIKNYDRSNERLQKNKSKFFLEIPDLSEAKPSVTKGDRVHIRLQDNFDVVYEGIIHELHENGLLLGFHNEFTKQYIQLQNSGVDPKVDVRFTVNRFPIRNMHRALRLLKKHHAQLIMFPEVNGFPLLELGLRPWVNQLIRSNPEQQLAVKNILNKTSGSAPYLVFGPPGTGKTVTLVETIVQVWYASKHCGAKQLVCAPSNTACNNIAERLISSLPERAKIFRLFSLNTEVSKVPTSILTYSNYDEKEHCFYYPDIHEIMKKDIIIVTIVTSGRLVTGGAGGQFQYVYIDECGQASEPEALIAIAGILTTERHPSTGQLVLAGDPQQLGPILSSQLAVDFGLGMSLLERLMKHNDLYKKAEVSGYNSKYLTKLVQNFRSHPAILRIPNELFYDNELQPKGNPDIINRAVSWEGLPNKQFPLFFHGVQGIDERESNSPSFFNRQEIERVITYVKKLLKSGLPNHKVVQEDIGVITPYRKQVQKFKKAFRILKLEHIKVGSVEEFQGSEKLIIFISTVRSNIALMDEDYKWKLGFLRNPKRFNVSVTRAQALLIIVGNPKILRYDKQWFQLLKYCHENGATIGIPFSLEDPPEYQQEHLFC